MTIKGERDKLAFFRGKCKEHGMRVTHQKTMIYKTLLNSHDHSASKQIVEKKLQ